MKIEVVCRDDSINKILDIQPIGYKEALAKAFAKVESNGIVSSWKDALSSSSRRMNISDYIEVPSYGCFIDKRKQTCDNRTASIQKIWQIGGKNDWYTGNWLWRLRGYMDKMVGGMLHKIATAESTSGAQFVS